MILKKNGFTYEPYICPNCHIGTMELKNYTKVHILNPYYIGCNNTKCRKYDKLRKFSFLNKLRYWSARVAFNILENFILYGLNSNKLKAMIGDKYHKNISIQTIQKYLLYIRKIIYQHMEIKYSKTLIGGFDDYGN